MKQKVEAIDRRFEYKDQKIHKYWVVRPKPLQVDVEYGAVGGQIYTTSRSFKSEKQVRDYYHKKILEKFSKGYFETDFQGRRLASTADDFYTRNPDVPLSPATASKPRGRVGARWTDDEQLMVSRSYKEGQSVGSIAGQIGRSALAVEIRLFNMGLIKQDPRTKV